MTPEQMQARAVQALAEEFDRSHDDPHGDAQRWIGRLMRAGWRPQPALVETPQPARRAPAAVQKQAMADIRATLAKPRGQR